MRAPEALASGSRLAGEGHFYPPTPFSLSSHPLHGKRELKRKHGEEEKGGLWHLLRSSPPPPSPPHFPLCIVLFFLLQSKEGEEQRLCQVREGSIWHSTTGATRSWTIPWHKDLLLTLVQSLQVASKWEEWQEVPFQCQLFIPGHHLHDTLQNNRCRQLLFQAAYNHV